MQITKTRLVSFTWLAFLAAAGCHAPPAIKSTYCVCTPNGPCGGYYSTCWREWPLECPSCPPMTEAVNVAPSEAAPGEAVPPPSPPQLQEFPDDLPPATPDEMDQSRGVIRGRGSPRAVHRAPVVERPPAPGGVSPPGDVRHASPPSNEPVVFRRTTVELLAPPGASDGGQLLTPPSYSARK